MVVEETIFEANDIRVFKEVDHPSTEERHDSHRCACGRTVCCGKHKCCSKAAQTAIRFKKDRSY